jgi:hygromycin-B 7''-O-kinase
MLPDSKTYEQFDAIDKRADVFTEAAQTVLNASNIKFEKMSFPTNGSLPVVLIDSAFAIKFFPPIELKAFENEVKALDFLAPHGLSPKKYQQGEIEGWTYILMSQMPGQSLKDLYPQFSDEQKQLAFYQIGQATKKLHSLSVSDLNFDLTSWSQFLEMQKQACYSRHEKIGLREDLLKQIPPFLNSVKLNLQGTSYLHTEIMRDHSFFDIINGAPVLSGFIDFEPSMIGTPEYDFASVGVFLAMGDKKALRSFFEGYGNITEASKPEFRRRIMAYLLLHKYSNLKWYLQFLPSGDSLDALADLWWAV